MIKPYQLIRILIVLLASSQLSAAQEIEKTYSATPTVKVYAHMYSGLNQQYNPTAVELTRAYIGYNVKFQKGFSSKIILDIGSPDNTSSYALLKRYAYFKSAYLQYATGKFNFKFGIIPMQLFKVQESVWGHRYIEQSASDKYKFGSSSDLGISANYKVSRFAEIDLTLSNGEGNATVQQDNTYKTALGLTLKPYKGFIIRSFVDYLPKSSSQITWVAFIGYMKDKIAFGLEYDKQYNVKNNNNQDLRLFSATASYNINSKFQIFGRYDIFRSNTLTNETQPWNIANDGSAIIGGIQFSPISNVRMALNYQDWVPYAKNLANQSFLYFNIEFAL